MGNAIQVFGLQQNQAQLGATRIEEINENNYGQGVSNTSPRAPKRWNATESQITQPMQPTEEIREKV